MSPHAAQTSFRKSTRLSVGRDQLLNLLEITLDPLVLVFSLWALAWWWERSIPPAYILLALLVFSLTFPGPTYLTRSPMSVVRHIFFGWLVLGGLLFGFGYLSGLLNYFNGDVLVTWWVVAPVSQLAAHVLLRLTAPVIIDIQGSRRRAIVAGMNAQGVELARRLTTDPYSRVRIVGFFDDRDRDRLTHLDQYSLLGNLADLPAFIKDNQIELLYVSLPMASQPRILSLLERLHDTTASIYFVPDIFVTDLIQGRMDSVGGLPVVAVCETPFTGWNGMVKRLSDIVLSLLILVLIAPLLLITAIGVKLSSPGPVIFRQRRYGLDGREIIVYKFRTMTVCEDGAEVAQASKEDARVTPLGRWLRKLSIDELPQFVNVLQGRMSIVGPRPHAVAHNEMYRKLIRSYMVRHKVKPGITGWAQVNGYRGETETLEKMKGRIDYDLDYLRNWSLRLDLYIIARTIWVVLSGKDAY